jgi:NAD(P)-dependent dehydrogenase (short-subunit alcohol dehydrogenase family)
MLTRASASALAKYRIRVNAIAPGLVETNINQAQRNHQPEVWEQRKTMIPLKRAGKLAHPPDEP